MNLTSRNPLSPRYRLSCFVLPLLLALPAGCSKDGGTSDDDDDGNATPTPADEVQITFGLEDGQSVSQTVSVVVTGGAATSMAFLAPDELVGVDLDSDPAVLEAQWDTTTNVNGEVTITVEADGPGGPATESITVYRSNISAALKGVYTAQRGLVQMDYLEDGDYARNGSPLMLSFTASPFGATPTLNRIEVRGVSGGGLSPAVPIQGVQDGEWWDFNLGIPSEGTIHLLVAAVNNMEEYSEPFLLDLVVLRNDIVSPSQRVPYDFEVSPDGKTGVLLLGNSPTADGAYIELVDLSDPSNPTWDYVSSNLVPTTCGTPGSGNVLLSPDGGTAYVMFPNCSTIEIFDLIDKLTTTAGVGAIFAPNSGLGLAHINRSPYATVSPDGRYLFGVISGGAQVVMFDTQETGSVSMPNGNAPVGGIGLMAPHPSGDYVYFVNGWGDSESATGMIQILLVNETPSFLDISPTAMGAQGLPIQQGTDYVNGLQPLVTSGGDFLLTTWCKRGSGSGAGETAFVPLSLTTEGAANPTKSMELPLYTASGTPVLWGTPVAVSPDDNYLLIGDAQPNLGGGVVVDLSRGTILSDIVFPNGVADGVFLSNTLVLTTSSDWGNRDMTIADLSQGTTEEVTIPGLTGLQPPSSDDDMRNNIIVQRGDYVYFVAPARLADTNGVVQTLGVTMSVYAVALGQFVFPNPVGG